MDKIALGPGNVTYPTRNFATLGPSKLLLDLCGSGRVISAQLCMSPCRSDYIILRIVGGLAYSL